MKLPKLSKSRPSSATASPVSTPRALDSPTPKSPCPSSPNSPTSSKPANNKSLWPEKAKSLQLRLPSLSRSRSRSRREFASASDEPSPVAQPSPLGKSNSNKHQLNVNHTQGTSSNSQAICAQDEKHTAAGSLYSNAPDPLVEEIKLVFEKFDANGDGKISAYELCCVLRSLGDETTQEEAELMVAEADTDKDGFIDLQEFINLNTRTAGGGSGGMNGTHSSGSNETDELAAAFDMFDLDKNGCITPDELHCVLGNLGNRTSTLEDCKRMIRGVDRKGSGHVDFDDFKIMMTSNTSIMA